MLTVQRRGVDNDRLYSGRGPDTIDGGGSDTIESRAGNDAVYADDGERDVIDCGGGRDQVQNDSLDDLSNCEEDL